MSDQIDPEMARPWLLRSKLELPRNNVRLVGRPRLRARMQRWFGLDLATVIAPAGYAKSTTVAEWCREERDRGTVVAWLSLDEGDAEPTQFLSYLVASLSTAGLDLQGLEAGAEEGFFASGIPPALSTMLDAIARAERPVLVVLDDYYRLASPAVDTMLRGLLQNIPTNMTFVVTSRSPLPFDIAHLLAAGRADELTSEALRFTADELAEVFEQPIGEEALALLLERTEGWPVAVQLARLLVGDDPSNVRFDNFHGDSGHIATYLADQIVSGLEPDLQSFLLQTAPLEHFNDRLAAAVTERPDSLRTIARLEPLGALIVPTVEGGAGYRYHHLFAEYLRNEQRRRFGDAAVDEVHRRASRWYEQNGYMSDAVRHARLSGDYARCAKLIEDAGGWELILFGGIGYLRGLLQQLPDAVIHAYPRISVAKAYSCIKDGLLPEARILFDIAVAARDAAAPGDAALERDLLNVGVLLTVYEDHHIDLAELERRDAELNAMVSADAVTRSILSCHLVVYDLALGRFGAADRRAQQAMRWMRQARTMLGLNYCYLHAGLAALYQGRLRAAEAHFGVAQRMAEENFAYDPGLRAMSRLLASSQKFWAGGETDLPAEQIRSDLDQVESYDGWVDIYYSALIVEHGLLNDPERALERLRRIARARGLERLDRLADAFTLMGDGPADRTTIALGLRQALPDEAWKADPFVWLTYLESRLGLAAHFAAIDRSRAIRTLTDALACARELGAFLHVIRILVARAQLLDLSGSRVQAIEDMVEALALAAPEAAYGPFLASRGAMPLLRAVGRHAQDAYVDILVVDFAATLVARLARQGDMRGGDGGDAGLSLREREVLEELAHGRSNKEIARLLDMTEHTVKFHLKNVFAKLDVARRTQAVARARELGLI